MRRNLENRLKDHGNWAYTGSLAMKIHANRLGVNLPPGRSIGNINIASNRPLFLVPLITSKNSKWRLNNAPNEKHTVFVAKNNKNSKLNLFKAGRGLAPSMNKVQHVNGIPVMRINALLNKKLNMRNNVFKNENKKKLETNIAFLKLLLRMNSSSPKRRRTNSPNGNRSVSRGGRKLMF
jgi:hypothetical protein